MAQKNRKGSAPVTRRLAMVVTMGMAIEVVGATVAIPRSREPKFSGDLGNYYAFDSVVTFPDIRFEGKSRQYYRLTDMIGRVVVLNFWATWCPPCVNEMPDLDRLQARYANRNFIVLTLCEDAEGFPAVERFFQDHRLQHLQPYIDPQGKARRDCSVPSIPASFLIDRTGRPRGILPGAAAWDAPAAHDLIDYYLAGN